ncbi:MAG: hypothetical protein Q8P73_04445 [bacterium]|nr:hypothetical protein [bacterium]
MSMESIPRPEKEQPVEPQKHTPERLLKAIDALNKTVVGKVEVFGKENLKELKPDENVIIATSHIEDPDVTLAVSVLGRSLDIAITNQSVHHTFLGEPGVNIGMRIAGRENFLPISYKKSEGKKVSVFDPADFDAMKEPMTNGKSLVVAAQNPTFTGQLGKGGVGAVYLAQITGKRILPFAVDMDKKEGLLKRPDARTHIGKPFELEHIDGIENLVSLDQKRKEGTLSPEERQNYKDLLSTLKQQSEFVMRNIAVMLPEEKRGIYREHPETK